MGERHVSNEQDTTVSSKALLKSFYKRILDMATDLSMSEQSTPKSAVRVMRKFNSTLRGNNPDPSSHRQFIRLRFYYAFEYSMSIVVLHQRFLFFANPLLSQTLKAWNPDFCWYLHAGCFRYSISMFQRSFTSRPDVSQPYIDDSMGDRMEMGNVNDRYSQSLSIISQWQPKDLR